MVARDPAEARRRFDILRAVGGLAGPIVFTAAWTTGTALQNGDYSIAFEHLSGLAALNAVHPEIMIGGFVALGAGTALFAGALDDALGGKPSSGAGPRMIRAAGLATIAAGLLRRDHILLHPPYGGTDVSWHNYGHDAASALIYALLITAPFVLARRFRDDPQWQAWRVPALASGFATTLLLGLFWSKLIEPYNGIVQRIAVTIPAAAMAALAVGVLRKITDAGRRPLASRPSWQAVVRGFRHASLR